MRAPKESDSMSMLELSVAVGQNVPVCAKPGHSSASQPS